MYGYKKLLYSFDLDTRMYLLKQEACSLRQYIDESKMRYDKTMSFRHDIKNHLNIIKELLKSNKLQQALKYIGDMENITADISFPYNTNNAVLDILLKNKFGIAVRSSINVYSSLYLPYPCSISDIDFCIILSNAIDNALNACKTVSSEKYINIKGNIQGDFILIEVKNSIEHKIALKEGIGLKNIKMVAEKYNGAVNINISDNEFILSVLLIIPQ